MKTYYPSTSNRITSPYQVLKRRATDVQDKKNPAREEIEKCVGTYNLQAVIEEDLQTQSTMKIPGLVSFLCTLVGKNGKVIAQDRGSVVLNQSNTRFYARAVASAFNSSVAGAVIRATKVLDTFRTSDEPATATTLEEAYRVKENGEVSDNASTKQKQYLFELIQTNVEDESERDRLISQIDELSRSEASQAIQSYKR